MADNQLDDSVRNLFRRCEEYDRTHPGEAVLLQIFPEGKFSQIVNMNREEEPAVVEKLAILSSTKHCSPPKKLKKHFNTFFSSA